MVSTYADRRRCECCAWVCAQSYPTLCDSMDCSLTGSSAHAISQARILEWVAIFFSRGSCQPRDRTHISCIAGEFFTTEPPGKSLWPIIPPMGICQWQNYPSMYIQEIYKNIYCNIIINRPKPGNRMNSNIIYSSTNFILRCSGEMQKNILFIFSYEAHYRGN